MKSNHKKVIIVGAGIAGLTLAYKLCKDRESVLVVEKDPRVGGLAKSFEYDDFIFDIGPHRFYTEIKEVNDIIHEILGRDSIEIERKSGVWMFGRYMEWPLRISSISKMPLPVLLSTAADFFTRRGRKDGSFEDYITGRYGKTLYSIFFKPYTEKFLKIPCAEVSRDWAITGVDRAVIDERLRMDDLSGLARSLLSPKRRLNFVYPASGGIGVFSEKLKDRIVRSQGLILLNSRVSEIRKSGNEIKGVVIDDRFYECDLLVWTGQVNEVQRLLGLEQAGLEYLDLLLYNYRVAHPPKTDFQWCYFGTADTPFNRVSIPSLFNPSLAPQGMSGICAEVTCSKGDPLWMRPESLEPAIRRSLKDVGLIESETSILGVSIERIPGAYPIYSRDYLEKKRSADDSLKNFTNLRLLGRSGTFWYNNMDHSIGAAISLHRELTQRLQAFQDVETIN